MRLTHLCLIIGAAVIVLFIAQILLEIYLEDEQWKAFTLTTEYEFTLNFEEVTEPVVLWWVPLGGSPYPRAVKKCGQLSCYFTDERRFRHHPLIKVLIFYGTMLNLTDVPLPRDAMREMWALLHEESPRNNAPLSHLALLSLFNYTATVSRHSSLPLTTQYLQDVRDITGLKYFVQTEKKNQIQKEEGFAPVMYLQTDCSTPTNRDSYVAELSKHIPIDSYGACLHNKDLPPHLQPPNNLETMLADDLLHLVAKYKFVLAIENGVCYDYITEKLWRSLIAGSVPIYIGSPTVSDWLPNNKSAVLGLDFDSPKDLAEHLHLLNSNDELYNSYLEHKLKSQVTNPLLVSTMELREWDTDWTTEKVDYIQAFECFLCRKAHNQSEKSVATRDHYHCPMPVSILSREPNTTNFWLDSWFYGACEAKAFRQLVDSGKSHFPQQEFDDAMKQLVLDRKCQYSEENAIAMNGNIKGKR